MKGTIKQEGVSCPGLFSIVKRNGVVYVTHKRSNTHQTQPQQQEQQKQQHSENLGTNQARTGGRKQGGIRQSRYTARDRWDKVGYVAMYVRYDWIRRHF
jgi:hypothetical protein